MKIRGWCIRSGRLGPHASCVHLRNLVHARCVRSQGSGPMSGATATDFHSQWRAAGSWKLGGTASLRLGCCALIRDFCVIHVHCQYRTETVLLQEPNMTHDSIYTAFETFRCARVRMSYNPLSDPQPWHDRSVSARRSTVPKKAGYTFPCLSIRLMCGGNVGAIMSRAQ